MSGLVHVSTKVNQLNQKVEQVEEHNQVLGKSAKIFKINHNKLK